MAATEYKGFRIVTFGRLSKWYAHVAHADGSEVRSEATSVLFTGHRPPRQRVKRLNSHVTVSTRAW
jgi:hypothetical protein